MSSHLESFVRVSVVLVLALGAMPLLGHRAPSARRLVLSVALAVALVGPFLPAWHVGGPAVEALVGRVVAEPGVALASAGPAPASSAAPPVDWLAVAWAIGACFVAARSLRALLVARRLTARARPAGSGWTSIVDRAERHTGLRAIVRVSTETETPFVTGVLTPVVVVPSSAVGWTDERKLSVLLHELAHVAAHDLRVQVVAVIACTLHWCNPLVWLVTRRLRLERELAADEAVLCAGVRPSSYAADLLAIAGPAPSGAMALGEKPLATRVAAIVAARRPRALGRKTASALAMGVAVVALAVACTTTTTEATPRAAHASSTADGELQAVVAAELDRAVTEWNASGGAILVMSPKGDVIAEAGQADAAYVTGSTVKSLVLAAAIDEGVVTESDVFDCARGEREGHVLHDASPIGRVALPELFARSSNIGIAHVFDRLGGARLDGALRRFHLVPPPGLAAARPGDWNGALAAIGVTTSATPRQITRAYAALADDGGGIVQRRTAARLSALLEGVVSSEHGTGKKARIEGVRVAGKTGSSEWAAADGSKKTYASFVGYVPAERPRYVVFVGVASPSRAEAWGGNVAAPVFSRVAARALSH